MKNQKKYIQRIVYRIKQFWHVTRTTGIQAAVQKAGLRVLGKIYRAGVLLANRPITAKDVIFIVETLISSTRYRVDNIADGLKKLGFDVRIIMKDYASLIDLEAPPKVAVIFRCSGIHALEPILISLREHGVTLVADIDDIIFEPEIVDQIEDYRRRPRYEQTCFLDWVDGCRRVMAACQKGTTTTAFLASRMRHVVKEVAVIPNTVNEMQLQTASNILAASSGRDTSKERLTILYLSGSKTHQRDFAQCAEALARFMRERRNVHFHLVGLLDLPPCFADLQGRIRHTPFVPYLDLLSLTAAADINIAPLENTSFNQAKSELKIFEAGLVQVPTIASPVNSYAEYVEDGVDGLLAEMEDEWFAAFGRLADDPDLCAAIGLKAREKALKRNHYLQAAQIAADFYGLTHATD